MLTNFGKRMECKETGVITAVVSYWWRERVVIRKDMVWLFMSGSRALTAKEQEYCTQMNFKAEQYLDVIGKDVKYMTLNKSNLLARLLRWNYKILTMQGDPNG